jgi:hypothetical protein
VFRNRHRIQTDVLLAFVGSVAAADGFELNLYDLDNNPDTTTPTLVETCGDQDFVAQTSANALVSVGLTAARTLEPNRWYAITTKVTNGTIIIQHLTVADANLSKLLPLGGYGAGRQDGSGAFTLLNSGLTIPLMGFMGSFLSDGLGGS